MPDNSAAHNPALHNPGHVSDARLFLRALSLSFFSVFSLILAFYAFLFLPQVQDLLFDAKPHMAQGFIYWAGFYLIGICFWALPLVFTARLLLLQNFDVIGVDTEERFRFIVFRLPSLFAVFAFIAVLLGIWAASENLPTPSPPELAPHEHEKTLRAYLENHLITLFLVTAGVLVLVIIRNFFLLGYGRQMEVLETSDPERFKRTLVRFEKLSRRDRPDYDALDLHLTALKPDFLTKETWIAAQRVKVFMWRYLTVVTWIILALALLHFISYSSFVEGWFRKIGVSGAPWLNQAITFVSDSLSFKRAAFLHILFGAWLPFAALLAILSNRYQFPFITVTIVAAIALTLFTTDGHDARITRLSDRQLKARAKPVTFQEAIGGWKEASGWNERGCEALAADAPGMVNCPRPIIVAGEGGGSRAAFLFASVLGNLQDKSLDKVNCAAGKKCVPGARRFSDQLFAISAVSGSSVGAAFFMGALRRHERARKTPAGLERLKKALYRQRLWFLNVARTGTEKEKFLHEVVTYKDALQAALSNDFLSPVMIGYLARDVPTLSRFPMFMDRAGIIETAWEDAFNDVYGLKRRREITPLGAPLLSYTPRPGHWMPLMFLNATSNETGRRIIMTPIRMTAPVKPADDSAPPRQLFADSYDAHELLCSAKDSSSLRRLDRVARFLPSLFGGANGAGDKCDEGARGDSGKPVAFDLRLSTAVSMSARSPVVSPHANLRDRSQQIVDSAVDGGYFDNSGAVTAVETARALKLADPRLRPFILQVSSEPEWFPDRCQHPENAGAAQPIAGRPKPQDEADFKPLGTFGNLLTVNATRVARAFETMAETPDQMGLLNGPGVHSHALIYVCPQPKESFLWDKFLSLTTSSPQEKMLVKRQSADQTTQENAVQAWKSVSLSWWLSPPLQAYLDGQVYAPQNRPAHDCVLSLLRPPASRDPSAPDPCAPETLKAVGSR